MEANETIMSFNDIRPLESMCADLNTGTDNLDLEISDTDVKQEIDDESLMLCKDKSSFGNYLSSQLVERSDGVEANVGSSILNYDTDSVDLKSEADICEDEYADDCVRYASSNAESADDPIFFLPE